MSRGVSLFFRDITREKLLTAKLEKEHVMREKRIESLSHLAGGLAHEISNPLAIMHAVASDLKVSAGGGGGAGSGGGGSVRPDCADVGQGDGDPAGVAGFFAGGFARSYGERLDLQIALGCVDLQLSRFERHKIELRLVSEPRIPPICCREVQIGQILTNLIGNAFDSIEAAACEERWVSIQLSAAG